MYEIVLSSAARRELSRLPESIYAAVTELLGGDLRTNPHRVGKPLYEPFKGLHVVRRGSYRVLYEIHDEIVLVNVIRIRHRRDAYRKN